MGLSRKLRAGDVVKIGSAVITCVNGSCLRVQIDAPPDVKVEHKPRKALTRQSLKRKTKG